MIRTSYRYVTAIGFAADQSVYTLQHTAQIQFNIASDRLVPTIKRSGWLLVFTSVVGRALAVG